MAVVLEDGTIVKVPELKHAPSVNDVPDNELLQRVLRNLNKRGRSREKLPFWSIVGDKFGLGSGYASQLCRRFGLDPDEIVKR